MVWIEGAPWGSVRQNWLDADARDDLLRRPVSGSFTQGYGIDAQVLIDPRTHRSEDIWKGLRRLRGGSLSSPGEAAWL